MDYNVLKSEIQKQEYAGLSDIAIADILNKRDRVGYREITSRELMVWAGQNSRYAKLFDAAIEPTSPEVVRSICLSAIQLLERQDAILDLNKTDIKMMLGGLVQSGVFTVEDKTALEKMAEVPMSRGEELFGVGTNVYFEHIEIAKK